MDDHTFFDRLTEDMLRAVFAAEVQHTIDELGKNLGGDVSGGCNAPSAPVTG